jgi:2Fe-2S ferredoxin
MDSIKVIFVQEDGAERVLQNVALDQSLMEAARAHGVAGIYGDCGGGCACATCHVYIDPEWQTRAGAPDEVESGVLDLASEVQQGNSRLCCQIKARRELDGIRVTVAPTSR